jgi:hypothetical protein
MDSNTSYDPDYDKYGNQRNRSKNEDPNNETLLPGHLNRPNTMGSRIKNSINMYGATSTSNYFSLSGRSTGKSG